MDDENQYNLDSELLTEFLSEAQESLAGLDDLFIELENRPENVEVIQQIFRPIHSIKGNAAFFNLSQIKTLAHDLESLIDRFRKRTLVPNKESIDILLAGKDTLVQMVDRVIAGEAEVEDQESLEKLFERIASVDPDDGPDDQLVQIASKALETVSTLYTIAGEDRFSQAERDEIFDLQQRCRNYLKEAKRDKADQLREFAVSDSVYLVDGKDITGEMHQLADLLSVPLEGEMEPEKARQVCCALQRIRECAKGEGEAIIGEMMDEYNQFTNSAIGFENLLRERLAENLARFARVCRAAGAEGNSNAGPAATMGVKQRTIRIDENKVDEFMGHVSELMILSETFQDLKTNIFMSNIDVELQKRFQDAVVKYSNVSDRLQKSILGIRRVSARQITRKISRMIRDLCEQLGKEAEAEIQGEDIQLDKSLVEAIDAPLTHILRNCLDHGIEPPEERVRQGKPPAGKIRIIFSSREEKIHLTVEDDGRGIDAEALKDKAVKMGILSRQDAERLSRREALEIIFYSGMTTTRTVSDISGRGVGMDVVRTSVDSLGGAIDVESEQGHGTSFHLTFPINLSTVVREVIAVHVGEEEYCIPVEEVQAICKMEKAVPDVSSFGEMVRIREEIYQLVRLNRIFNVYEEKMTLSKGSLVCTSVKGRRCALFVDDVLGRKQVVIRQFDMEMVQDGMFQGVAVYGNGQLSLVLELERITRLHELTRISHQVS